MNLQNLPLEIKKIILNYLIDLEISKKSKYFTNIHTELLHGYWMIENEDDIFAYTKNYNPIKIINNYQIINIINNSKGYAPFLYLTTPEENKWAYPHSINYEFAYRIPKLQ